MSKQKDGIKASKTESKRPLRADAVRNEDALLQAAKEVFLTSGVNAPVRDIAAKAGVGIGTLYRRFPQRSDLVASVFCREVDACVAEAATLAAENDPLQALTLWLKRYVSFLAAKKGLAAALHSGDPAFETLPAYFRANFQPALATLMASAKESGEIQTDIDPYDLLRAIANLSVTNNEDDIQHTYRILDLLIKGLLFGGSVSTAEV
ncbi:TetR/AcrR family transcriptional regulator [Microbulbifer sp. OS29]|uniref:TetR/AcrR family transcriptional regulator n=1 Tax=Microbulbifer okhotskensis TaxID=2926617 RepID=A0A9X2J3R4_9GAMM|nr:TetR/AcrR family transcriptional regulator [Microbulbifer okhotskensis]MCO1333792.1 TetR/AcrR family transcriptional regulator [Microbulbifer okhotskensis]